MLPPDFATGRARFTDVGAGRRERPAKVYVPVSVGGFQLLAQLDTGAAWSVFPSEVCAELNLLNGDGPVVSVSTRLGSRRGRLERVTITLVASEGVSLDVDSTIFACDEWDHDAFIGWGGCLERVRIALDPGHASNYVYFGAVAR